MWIVRSLDVFGIAAGGVVIAQRARRFGHRSAEGDELPVGLAPEISEAVAVEVCHTGADHTPDRVHLAACRGFEDADNSTVARQSAERNSQKRPAVRAASPEERTADTHHALRVELEAVPPQRVAVASRDRVAIDRFRLLPVGRSVYRQAGGR